MAATARDDGGVRRVKKEVWSEESLCVDCGCSVICSQLRRGGGGEEE